MSKTILIVDDDSEIRHLSRDLLEKNHFRVHEAENSEQIFHSLQTKAIDLILLDVMLDGEDGFVICRKLREISTVPIIMVTALGEAADRVIGLEYGADDYIVKPFYPREMIARIRSVLRRSHLSANSTSKTETKICFAGWTLLPAQRRLFSPDNVEVSLSAREYALLEFFLKNANRILTRDQLLNDLHGDQLDIFDRTIDVQVSRLRKRIEINPRQPQLIKTVRSGGYLFTADVQELRM
jgi:two-component system, OmpR family, response regulator